MTQQRSKFRSYLLLAMVCLLATLPVGAQQKKPNILVIWGDDIGWDNISAYNHGMMGYQTPNIDRIAKEGALFTTLTRSRVARQAARRSFSESTRFAPDC